MGTLWSVKLIHFNTVHRRFFSFFLVSMYIMLTSHNCLGKACQFSGKVLEAVFPYYLPKVEKKSDRPKVTKLGPSGPRTEGLLVSSLMP